MTETAPGRGLLLEKLMGTVRAEFRVEVFVPHPDEPVLGVKQCLVGDCDRTVSENALCSAHARRWRATGCADVSAFAADAGPVLNGRSQPGRCTVIGCGFGVNAHGLCMRHYRAVETCWLTGSAGLGSGRPRGAGGARAS